MTKPYKLLTVDLDGTLVRRDGTVHPEDRRAIERLREAGVPVAIVTGRLYSGSCSVAREVGIRGPIACVDGSQIVDTRGDRPLSVASISGEPAGALRAVLSRRPSAHFVFAGDRIVHDLSGQPYAPYVRTWSESVHVVPNVVEHDCWTHEDGVLAVVAVGEPEHIDASAEEIGQEVRTARVMSFSVRRYEATSAMVIRARGSDKGTAVDWLADYYDCQPEEVVAVGDWLNDIPMMKRAGRSFVMAQGPEEVKQHATDRLEASMNDGGGGGGVAEAVRRAFELGG